VKIWCASDDFTKSLITIIPAEFGPIKEGAIEGDVLCDRFIGIGSNSVVMPDNQIPEGVAIGALSFVPANFSFEPWTVYAGTPIRKIRMRDRDAVLRQYEKFIRELAKSEKEPL
jgi:carbonic anhydrase/acetyltransferase-like protein (isoleucine patch superfamily)